MAKIIPFKGLRYDEKKVGKLSDVVTPPYDIISPAQQSEYYKKHENSVIRLEYDAQYESDTDTDNRYTRAASFLNEWLDNGVLKFEDKACIYLYEQRFSHMGQTLTYRGFLTLTHTMINKITKSKMFIECYD